MDEMNQMPSINIISININIIITVCIINNIIDHIIIIIIDVSSCGRLGVVIRFMKVVRTRMILLVGYINWEFPPMTPPTRTEADSTSMSFSLSMAVVQSASVEPSVCTKLIARPLADSICQPDGTAA